MSILANSNRSIFYIELNARPLLFQVHLKKGEVDGLRTRAHWFPNDAAKAMYVGTASPIMAGEDQSMIGKARAEAEQFSSYVELDPEDIVAYSDDDNPGMVSAIETDDVAASADRGEDGALTKLSFMPKESFDLGGRSEVPLSTSPDVEAAIDAITQDAKPVKFEGSDDEEFDA